jgi:hypothetical protein
MPAGWTSSHHGADGHRSEGQAPSSDGAEGTGDPEGARAG